MTPGTMPLAVNHLGQLPAVTISFNLTTGYALSDAVSTIEQTRQQIGIPAAVLGQFQGQAQAFQSSHGQYGPAADHRHHHRLYHSGHSV